MLSTWGQVCVPHASTPAVFSGPGPKSLFRPHACVSLCLWLYVDELWLLTPLHCSVYHSYMSPPTSLHVLEWYRTKSSCTTVIASVRLRQRCAQELPIPR